jgi:uncharacterized protein (TIGR03435 family)
VRDFARALTGLAIAESSGMGRRIDQLFELSDGKMRRLSRPGVLLGVIGLPVLCLAATAGLGESSVLSPRPSAPAQSPPAAFEPAPAKPSTALQIVAQYSLAPQAGAQPARAKAPATRPAFDAFEVATIKPTPADFQGGRFIRMQSAHEFAAKNFTLMALVAAAYNLNPQAISGGPDWADSDCYDIVAAAPNEARPNLDEQMSMLRKLLTDRFKLTFHREQKELSIYVLTVAKSGPKLKESTTPADEAPVLVNRMFHGRALLPARNATMVQLASILQRAVLDRPVMDKTGLSGRYDFDLEWTPDETQFGRQEPTGAPDIPFKPHLSPIFLQRCRANRVKSFQLGRGAKAFTWSWFHP